MARAGRILILLPLIVTLAASTCWAFSVERALENPVHLAAGGEERLIYLTYASSLDDLMVAYTEYDSYAGGYGGLVIESGVDEDTVVSAVVAKDWQEVTFGVTLRWRKENDPAWLFDLGAATKVGPVNIYGGVHHIPADSWKGITDDSYLSLGASLDLSEFIAIGIDAYFLDEPRYKGYILLEALPSLKTQVYCAYGHRDWERLGIDAWLTRGAWLFYIGYMVDGDQESNLRIGIGLRL